ncbi:MAG: hypothetical protein H6R38_556 [Deltaproteobacteria bacterium]|nr:hypothetical protein [Deltaproteobacteria bacterium]
MTSEKTFSWSYRSSLPAELARWNPVLSIQTTRAATMITHSLTGRLNFPLI